jgi:hypothetical protein
MGKEHKGFYRNLVIFGILLILFSLAAFYYVYSPNDHQSEMYLLSTSAYSSSGIKP